MSLPHSCTISTRCVYDGVTDRQGLTALTIAQRIVNVLFHAMLVVPARSMIHAASFIPSHLVSLELADAFLHLLVGVDAETLVLGDAGQLNVLCIKLLLHDLLEGAEGEGLCLLESQTPACVVSNSAGESCILELDILVVLVDELCLCAF